MFRRHHFRLGLSRRTFASSARARARLRRRRRRRRRRWRLLNRTLGANSSPPPPRLFWFLRHRFFRRFFLNHAFRRSPQLRRSMSRHSSLFMRPSLVRHVLSLKLLLRHVRKLPHLHHHPTLGHVGVVRVHLGDVIEENLLPLDALRARRRRVAAVPFQLVHPLSTHPRGEPLPVRFKRSIPDHLSRLSQRRLSRHRDHLSLRRGRRREHLFLSLLDRLPLSRPGPRHHLLALVQRLRPDRSGDDELIPNRRRRARFRPV